MKKDEKSAKIKENEEISAKMQREFEERVEKSPNLAREIDIFAEMTNNRTKIEYDDIDSSIAWYERVREAILESRRTSSAMVVLPKGLLDIIVAQNSSEWLVKRSNETEDIINQICCNMDTLRAFRTIWDALTQCSGRGDGYVTSIRIRKSEFEALLRKNTTHRTIGEVNAVKEAFMRLNDRRVRLSIEGQKPPDKKKKGAKLRVVNYIVDTPIWSLSIFGKEDNPEYVITISPLVFCWALTQEAKDTIGDGKNVYLKDRRVYAPSNTLDVEKSVSFMVFKGILARTTHKNADDMMTEVFGSGEASKQLRQYRQQQIAKWGEEEVKVGALEGFRYNAKRRVYEWQKRLPTLFDDWLLDCVNDAIANLTKCRDEIRESAEAYGWVSEHLVKGEQNDAK